MEDGYGDFMVPKAVKPREVSGMNMSWNLNLLSGPKLHIVCGNCWSGFNYRIPLIDYPKVACPKCNVLNEIPFVYR